MKFWTRTQLLVATTFLATITMANASTGISWRASFAQAQKVANSSNKLILVDFYTNWCEACEMLDKDVYTKPSVIRAAAQFVTVKVNAQQGGQALAAKYGVFEFPTIIILESDGTLVGKIVGYEEPPQFTSDLNQVPRDAKALPILLADLKRNPNDISSGVHLAEIYVRLSDESDAKSLVATVEKNGGSAKLGRVYSGLGDIDGGAGQLPSAIAWYTKATVSTDPHILTSAYEGIAICDLQDGKTLDAKAELKKILRIPGIPSDLREEIKQTIASLS